MLGVAIALYRSANVIEACLDSLLASKSAAMRVVLVDNASPDNSAEVVRKWAARNLPQSKFAEGAVGDLPQADCWLTLVRAPMNGGYAYAINRAIELLMADGVIDLFWVLNPDCTVAPDTAARYLRAGADGDFALMGGRTLIADRPDIIQSDGGRFSRWSGICRSVNLGRDAARATPPQPATLDFLTGANCVASRQFIDRCGLMDEAFFLYYEEVEWALRRGKMALRFVPDAVVCHIGGTAIGSGAIGRRASAFANYFNYRNRRRLIARINPVGLPIVYLHGMAKALQLFISGAGGQAYGLLAGLFALRPPASVREIAPSQFWRGW